MEPEKVKKLIIGDFNLKRFLKSGLIMVVSIYLFLCIYGCFYGDKVMFPVPPPTYTDTPETKKIELDNGTKITIFTQEVSSPDFYIIYSHGNAVDLGNMEPFMERSAVNLNCTMVGYDYPGYGTSEGKPSEDSVTKSIQAVYKYLIDKNIKAEKIIIWGRSVGSGPATLIAYEKPVAGLILESPFISAFRVVTRYPILPFDRFPNIDRIANVNCPVLVIHGKKDRVISFYHGKTIFNAAKKPKYCLWLDNAGHNNVEWIGKEKYWNVIKNFVETLKKEESGVMPSQLKTPKVTEVKVKHP